MRPSQHEQITQAKVAYLIPLNDPRYGDSIFRYAVYLQGDGEMEVLWPVNTLDEKLWKKELLPLQYHSNNKKWPAFHFKLGGGGYSKPYELASVLQQVNPSLTVYALNGYAPSLIKGPMREGEANTATAQV